MTPHKFATIEGPLIEILSKCISTFLIGFTI